MSAWSRGQHVCVLAAVTTRTTRRDAAVVHRPGCKAAGDGGAGMAKLARSRGRDVVRWLAHHYRSAYRSTGVAARTTRRNTCMGHRPGCKAAGDGGAAMASRAHRRGRDVVRRFGYDPGILTTMATRTVRVAGVIHCPCRKSCGVGVAYITFTSRRGSSRDMCRNFCLHSG